MPITFMSPYKIKQEQLICKIKSFRFISNPKKVSLNSISYFIDRKKMLQWITNLTKLLSTGDNVSDCKQSDDQLNIGNYNIFNINKLFLFMKNKSSMCQKKL